MSVRPIAACGTSSVFLSLSKAMEGITRKIFQHLTQHIDVSNNNIRNMWHDIL
jgi:hypothetical protein